VEGKRNRREEGEEQGGGRSEEGVRMIKDEGRGGQGGLRKSKEGRCGE
jgi:hypothetical protein